MKTLVLAAVLTGLSASAGGETINLRDGTKIEGEITGEMEGAILVRTKYGSLTVNKADILAQAPPEKAVPGAALTAAGEVFVSSRPAGRAQFTFKTVKPDTSTVQTVYYEDAAVIATETFSAAGLPLGLEGAIKDGAYMEYHEDGSLKTVQNMANGKKDGTFKAFFPGGQLQTEARYTQGVIDGQVTIRGESGTLQFEQSFKNGVPDGWFRQYDILGNVTSETFYADGKVSADGRLKRPAPQPEQGAQPAKEPGAKEPESLLTARIQRLARGERFSFFLNNRYIGKVQLDRDFNLVGQEGKLPDGSVKAYSGDGKLEKEFVFKNNEVDVLRVYAPGEELRAEYGYLENKAIKK